jgi:5-methylcytosine-specific restriction protein A
VINISKAGVRAAYAAAKRVYQGDQTESAAKLALVASKVMSAASASTYIRNLRNMLNGDPYHRTINAFATTYYLNKILGDFGSDAAVRAVTSVRAHLRAYRRGRPGQLNDIEEICDAFEAKELTTYDTEQRSFEQAVQASKDLSVAERTERLRAAPRKPEKVVVSTLAFRRNPDVVAEVLERAGGICEVCGLDAPFRRASTGEPYLEVHHKVRLADGGEDTVENAVAVCPNCHREAHYGVQNASNGEAV